MEKQHDLLNKELAELQSQIFDLKRDQTSSRRTVNEEYLKKDIFEKRLKQRLGRLRELESDVEHVENKIAGFNRELSKFEKEKVTALEFDKLEHKVQAHIKETRDVLDEEFDAVGEELAQIRDELLKEQTKILDAKIKQLDRSLDDVEGLKKDLRQIIRRSEKKKPIEKDIEQLEKRLDQRSFMAKLWAGILDFFEEEPEEVKPILVKKPKKKTKKKETNILPWIMIFLLIILALFLLYFRVPLYHKIQLGVAALQQSINQYLPKKQLEGIVIEVNEGDYVDIIPNVTDEDNDEITYTFEEPLDATGKWQTKLGDAGVYPITVVVSDGQTESQLQFTLVVSPINS